MVDGYEPSGLTPQELADLPPYCEIAGMSFAQIEALYGAEIAINVGIATDPDAWVPTDAEWAQARPAIAVDPHLVQSWRAGGRSDPAKEYCTIPLDHDLVDYLRQAGPDWPTRLNDILRQAVFNSDAPPPPAAAKAAAP